MKILVVGDNREETSRELALAVQRSAALKIAVPAQHAEIRALVNLLCTYTCELDENNYIRRISERLRELSEDAPPNEWAKRRIEETRAAAKGKDA
jgi:hypothetical protein